MSVMVFFALLGAVTGSFLNVVIYRLPLIVQGVSVSLSWPPSHCPLCKGKIRYYHNVPVIGWLWLKGRCFHCRCAIHWRYPLVELLTSTLFIAVILVHGVTLQSLADLLMLSLLIPLFFIDIDTLLLPDRLTFPLLLIALSLAAIGHYRTELPDALCAAATGFGIPWILDRIYTWRHARPGMGMGDMKLFAAIGAWLGTEALFSVMLLSSVLAIFTVSILLRKGKKECFPFGPFLIAAAIVLFFCQSLSLPYQ